MTISKKQQKRAAETAEVHAWLETRSWYQEALDECDRSEKCDHGGQTLIHTCGGVLDDLQRVEMRFPPAFPAWVPAALEKLEDS